MIETPDHHGSHSALLLPAIDTSAETATFDAIIVPTVRPSPYLVDAAQIALALGCPLVTLHSGKWTSAAEASRRIPARVDLIAIDVPHSSRLRLPDLATVCLLVDTPFVSPTDTSVKRNLGLMLAHMLGWSRVLFLDDDVRVSRIDSLRHAAALLGTHHAAGLVVTHFRDHSVVCHAYRMMGGDQDPFIGGGALAAEVKREHSFFPAIYNDDWFYLLDAQQGLRQVAVAGTATQWPYDPFLTPRRAREEEFGDVLAEGVFWVLDHGGSVSDADLSHWTQFLGRRKRFIEQVLALVSGSSIPPADRGRMTAALQASMRQLARIKPEMCVSYLQAWASDRDRWLQHLNRLPAHCTREQALRHLSCRGGPSLTWYMGALGLVGSPPGGVKAANGTSWASGATANRGGPANRNQVNGTNGYQGSTSFGNRVNGTNGRSRFDDNGLHEINPATETGDLNGANGTLVPARPEPPRAPLKQALLALQAPAARRPRTPLAEQGGLPGSRTAIAVGTEDADNAAQVPGMLPADDVKRCPCGVGELGMEVAGHAVFPGSCLGSGCRTGAPAAVLIPRMGD